MRLQANRHVLVQAKVDETYRDRAKWTRMSIMSTAGSAFFSSDRTIVRCLSFSTIVTAQHDVSLRADINCRHAC